MTDLVGIVVHHIRLSGERRAQRMLLELTPDQNAKAALIGQNPDVTITVEVLSDPDRTVNVCLEHEEYGDHISLLRKHPGPTGFGNYVIELLDSYHPLDYVRWLRTHQGFTAPTPVVPDLDNWFDGWSEGGLDGTLLQTKDEAGETIGMPVVNLEVADEKGLAVAELSGYRHAYYAVEDLDAATDSDADPTVQILARDGDRTPDVRAANLISSELVDANGDLTGYHTVALDIDLPVRVRPTSTPGHHHLFIDAPMTWDAYRKLLDVLVEVGIVEPGYAAASLARNGTHLRLPWVAKPGILHGDTEIGPL